MPRKLLGLLFLIILVSCGCAQKSNEPDLYQTILKKDKIVVGTSFNSKPFAFVDKDGKVKGIEADLAREIAKRMLGDPNKVVFKDITPQERIKAVKAGDVDILISTMTITPRRKRLISFSEPYFVAGQVVCVKKDRKIESIDDLINKRVIVILGTTGEDNIRRFAPNIFIWGYGNNEEAINAFKNEGAEAITTDDALLQGLAMENSNYVILPKKLTEEPYGIAFRKSRNTKAFKENLNKILNDIHDDGTLNAIKEKWGVF